MCKRLLLSIAFAVVAGKAFAGGGLWQGNLGNGTAWDTAASWERGVPTLLPGDATYITYAGSGETEGPVIDSSTNAESYNLILGWDSFTPSQNDTVTMTMTGGSLTIATDFWIGKDDPPHDDFFDGPGIFDISDGTVTVGATSGTGHLVVGQGAEGTVNQMGGSISAWRFVLDWYNEADPAVGRYNLHGGTLEVTDNEMPLHFRTNGSMDITEGTMLLASDHTGTVVDLIASNQITAYGGAGTVIWDYDVTHAGMTTVWAVSDTFQADFDNDGDVDGDDFLLWQGGFGTPSGAAKMDGDYDNDGDVDGDDFLGWQAEFGLPGSGEGSGSAAVPEPATLILLFVVAAAASLRGCRHARTKRG